MHLLVNIFSISFFMTAANKAYTSNVQAQVQVCSTEH